MKLGSLLFVCFIVLSCSSKKTSDKSDFFAFIEDENNGLKRTVEYQDFMLTLKYRPTDLIVQQQLASGTKKEYDSLTNYFSQFIYFNLVVTYKGKDLESAFAKETETFASKVTYLNTGFSNDIRLREQKDTLSILDYVYQRSYGMGSSNFLLVFNRPESNQFTIDLKAYPLGLGHVSFVFNQSDIRKTPRLKLKLS